MDTQLLDQSAIDLQRRERASLARRALGGALMLGILADLLLREEPPGIGFALWMLGFSGSVTILAWRRDALSREQAGWLALGTLFAAGVAWRGAEVLRVFDFLAVLGILLILFSALAGTTKTSIFAMRVRDLAWGAIHAAGNAAGGILPLIARASSDASIRRHRHSRARSYARAALLTLPLLIVFGSLFRSADPIFASIIRVPEMDFEEVASHVFLAGFFTWIVAGWMRGAFAADDVARLPDGSPIVMGRVEVTMALGSLVGLFALFVLVQLGWLFGGEALVRRTTGLSIAEYARRGFFELIWVSVLTLPVLLATHAALPAGDEAVTTRFRRLAAPLLLLLGAVMVSAMGRMALYIRYFGLSVDRIYATAVIVWLAIVFVWFALTLLRGRARRFAGGMVVSGLAVLAALNVANPDVIVARSHIARGGGASDPGVRQLDADYLTRLSGDAMPDVVKALVALPPIPASAPASEQSARCQVVQRLIDRFDSRDESGEPRRRRWTTWNRGDAIGERAIREHRAELERMRCAPVKQR